LKPQTSKDDNINNSYLPFPNNDHLKYSFVIFITLDEH
jgi:hypothetical protein